MIGWWLFGQALIWCSLIARLWIEKEENKAWHDPDFLNGVHVTWARGIVMYEKVTLEEWESRGGLHCGCPDCTGIPPFIPRNRGVCPPTPAVSLTGRVVGG